jgi:predicted permease
MTTRFRFLALGPVEQFVADLGYALRTLSRQKTFTAVAVATLALGIGVNVAIFSLTEQTLLRPLPVPEPDRLVNLADPGRPFVQMEEGLLTGGRGSDGGGVDTVFSYPMFRDLEREQQPFVGLAGHTFHEAIVSTGEGARLATLSIVSGSYFPVLGLRPALGRLLGPADDRVDGLADAAVLSHAYWQSDFGGDPDVLGQRLVVDDVPLTIVGVAPEGFHGTAVSARTSVFVPITISFSSETDTFAAAMSIPNHGRRAFYWVHLFGRLKPGVTLEGAAAAMNTLNRTLLSNVEAPMLIDADEQQREAFRARSLVLEAGSRGQTSSEILSTARNSLELLFAVSGLVLLLCCANIAGLVLLRATTRSGEMAVRASLGASRGRLASLQLSESLVLALPAALLALPVAWATLHGARRVPGIFDAAPDVGLSAAAALVATGVAVVSALAVGLVPVRGVIRTEPARALQAHGTKQTAAKGVARFRAALATTQIALSMALLATMGVFAQSLANIARLDLGVDIDPVVMFSVPPPGGIATDVSSLPFVSDALEAVPGVTSVAWSNVNHLLSLNSGVIYDATVEGVDAAPVAVRTDFVSADFFQTFGIALLAGRRFNDADAFRSAIANRRFAERLGVVPEALIGRTVMAPFPLEIVGIVDDVRFGKITDEIAPQVFLQSSGRMVLTGATTFYVRSTRPPAELMSAIRAAVASVDPTLPVTNLRTMEEQLRENTAIERFFAGTSTAFAVFATALAALGLYGVLAYTVAQRSREIGLRFALGAPAGHIRGLVLRQVAWMAVIGLVLGAVTASVLGRAARSLLFGVEPWDPLVLVAAAVVLTAVTFGAAYLPARRASRVDPMTVLRYE